MVSHYRYLRDKVADAAGCEWTHVLMLGTKRSTLSSPRRFEVAGKKGVMSIADPVRRSVLLRKMNQTASPS